MRRVIVTGGNAGIGLETAAALAERGFSVAITSRDASRGAAAASEIRRRIPQAALDVLPLDLARFASVRSFVDDVRSRYDGVDVLVNNAGLILTERRITEDGHEETFQVNHLGPFLLTNLLLDSMRPPARIVNVASFAHRQVRGITFDDLRRERGYGGMHVYAETKLANILFTRELARRLPAGVTANVLHPGAIRSGFGMDGDMRGIMGLGYKLVRPFMISPRKGAETSVYLASSPEVQGRTGEYWVRKKATKPSAAAIDDDAARHLWDLSAKLVGI